MNEMSEIAAPMRRPPDVEALRQSPARFVNREVSWLQFNMRVLEEAGNANHPLLERLRFVSISANNLDEFFMVRVAGLKGQLRAGLTKQSADGLTPAEQLEEIATLAQHLHARAAGPLADAARRAVRAERRDPRGRRPDAPTRLKYLQKLFREEIFPVLTPIAVDPAHPFPFIPNLGLHAGLRAGAAGTARDADGAGARARAISTASSRCRSSLAARGADRGRDHRHADQPFIHKMFPGYDVAGSGAFRIIRDSEIEIDDEAADLVIEFESALRQRRRGQVIRLEIEKQMPRPCGARSPSGWASTPATRSRSMGSSASPTPARSATIDRPDLKFAPYMPRFPERVRDYNGDCLRGDPAKDIARPPPVRELRRGGAVPDAGGARPGRGGDQADALPHLARQPDRQGAGARRRRRANRSRRWSSSRRGSTRRPISAGRATSNAPARRWCSASSS